MLWVLLEDRDEVFWAGAQKELVEVISTQGFCAGEWYKAGDSAICALWVRRMLATVRCMLALGFKGSCSLTCVPRNKTNLLRIACLLRGSKSTAMSIKPQEWQSVTTS